MGNKSAFIAAAALTAGLGIALASPAFAGQSNPVDRVSNPDALHYTDVDIARRKLHEPFVRDGIVTEPQRFKAITPGVGEAEVQGFLGAPVRRSGREWDYNFKFLMPQSENYLVCQYKVTFDGKRAVRETVWRRRQCQKIVEE